MSEVPRKTGIPQLIDTSLTNSFDFHIAATKFGKVVDEYTDYVAAVYIWNHSKQTGDPIADEAQFFAELNLGVLNTKTNQRGTISGNIKSRTQLGYWLAKLDTLLRVGETWIRTDSGIPETQKISDNKSRYHAINLFTGDERWIEYDSEESIVNVVNEKVDTLKTEWGIDNMSQEFMLYWYDKFHKAHDKVKEEYKKLIEDDVIDYFTEFSDSIGTLARTFEGVDATAIPILDLNFKVLDTVPSVVPPQISDKLDKKTQLLLLEMSQKTNAIHRRNIIQVMDTISTQNKNHSENLTSDYLHWIRSKIAAPTMQGIIGDTIGQVFTILNFTRMAKNSQTVGSPIYDIVIEDSMARVNFSKNRVHTLHEHFSTSPTTSDMLKAKISDVIDLS